MPFETGFERVTNIGNTLIDMYAKCGHLHAARKVFDRLLTLDVVTWSALITRYAQHGLCQEALQLFEHMQIEGVQPNKTTFLCTLKACSSLAALEQGRNIHTLIVECGMDLDLFLGNAMINMYAN